MEVGAGVKDLVTGIQHLGIPVKDMGASLEFYGKLGFEEAFSTTNNENRVVFVRQKNLVIELYEEKETAQRPGAVSYTHLDVYKRQAGARTTMKKGAIPAMADGETIMKLAVTIHNQDKRWEDFT